MSRNRNDFMLTEYQNNYYIKTILKPALPTLSFQSAWRKNCQRPMKSGGNSFQTPLQAAIFVLKQSKSINIQDYKVQSGQTKLN